MNNYHFSGKNIPERVIVMKKQKVRGYGTQNRTVGYRDVFSVLGICLACGLIVLFTVFFTQSKNNVVNHSTTLNDETEDVQEIVYDENELNYEEEIETIESSDENQEVINEDEIYETESVVVAHTSALEFSAPLKGTVNKGFSDTELFYSKTLEDWRLHSGIDISAKIGTTVTACADGVVEYAGNDVRYGHTIVILHNDSFESVYSNLTGTQMVKVGKDIKKGDPIGMVGDSAICETADEAHLHFEMKLNGVNVNPLEYFDI